jgi:hypothetical protein
MRTTTAALLAFLALSSSSSSSSSAAAARDGASATPRPPAKAVREGVLRLEVELEGEPAKLWIVTPTSDPFQVVRDERVDSVAEFRETRDARFRNRFLFAETPKIEGEKFQARFEWQVRRTEARSVAPATPNPTEGAGARFLEPDLRAPLGGPARTLLASVGPESLLREPVGVRARAYFDWCLEHLVYSKDGTGWGQGDLAFVCDEKRGNCTDFHTLFITFCRETRIAARFEMGLPLPDGSGEIAGYHCWAFYEDPETGWLPLDLTETWKQRPNGPVLFGWLPPNRVRLSVGRDLEPDPLPASGPMNFAVHPYAERDGAPASDLRYVWRFDEADSLGS